MLSPMSHPQITNTDAVWSLGALFVLKSRTPELEVIEGVIPPHYSPPLHRHDHVTESFYVLEGEIRIVVGDTDAVYGPGDFVRVPPAMPHSFLTGEEGGRTLGLVTPAGLWDFFTACGEPAPALTLPPVVEIPADLPQMVARYGGTVLGPPLQA